MTMDERAHKIARFVRGCTTDEQYTDLVERIEGALRAVEKDAFARAIDIVERAWGEPYADCIRQLEEGSIK